MSEWQDYDWKFLPYRDFTGRWVLLPEYTQRRRRPDGRWEYRERAENGEEYYDRTYY